MASPLSDTTFTGGSPCAQEPPESVSGSKEGRLSWFYDNFLLGFLMRLNLRAAYGLYGVFVSDPTHPCTFGMLVPLLMISNFTEIASGLLFEWLRFWFHIYQQVINGIILLGFLVNLWATYAYPEAKWPLFLLALSQGIGAGGGISSNLALMMKGQEVRTMETRTLSYNVAWNAGSMALWSLPVIYDQFGSKAPWWFLVGLGSLNLALLVLRYAFGDDTWKCKEQEEEEGMENLDGGGVPGKSPSRSTSYYRAASAIILARQASKSADLQAKGLLTTRSLRRVLTMPPKRTRTTPWSFTPGSAISEPSKAYSADCHFRNITLTTPETSPTVIKVAPVAGAQVCTQTPTCTIQDVKDLGEPLGGRKEPKLFTFSVILYLIAAFALAFSDEFYVVGGPVFFLQTMEMSGSATGTIFIIANAVVTVLMGAMHKIPQNWTINVYPGAFTKILFPALTVAFGVMFAPGYWQPVGLAVACHILRFVSARVALAQFSVLSVQVVESLEELVRFNGIITIFQAVAYTTGGIVTTYLMDLSMQALNNCGFVLGIIFAVQPFLLSLSKAARTTGGNPDSAVPDVKSQDGDESSSEAVGNKDRSVWL